MSLMTSPHTPDYLPAYRHGNTLQATHALYPVLSSTVKANFLHLFTLFKRTFVVGREIRDKLLLNLSVK